MKLETGKLYVLRNGNVVGPLTDYDNLEFRFTDANSKDNFGRQLSWRIDGSEQIDRHESMYDIVSEYVEPQTQQPLRWVENCKPDKPGIWALLCNGEIGVHDVNESEVKSGYLAPETRCYLGPIPEILPPKKKVVERLWVNANYEDGTGVLHWQSEVDGDGIPSGAGYWIRTDRIREVER